ncbi:glycosyl hydrolase family 5 [Pseudomonas sp. COR58]|uniref:Glycosyl hydrolase family 5 n=1 Tax=Pseudomonas ekonensis TaxID=2842353 RepID=A0ABS6PAS8_9PSED|nr:glycosyl hydrolase family 5 [Pseudomonas ekonensis]MBV4457584.1 glycosyl hydrolase family 5 [Pseudomonas ekonensis]
MYSAHLKRLGALACLLLGAAGQAHASELFPALTGTRTIGVQVKIQNFSSADAAQIKAAGFSFVRLGVWSDSLGDPAYQRQISDAFAVARAAGLPVLMTVRATRPLSAEPAAAGEAFAGAVTSLEASYRTQLVAIEVWNEPDLATYWPTGNFDTTFAPFMKGMCQSLRGKTSSTPLIGFGFARPPSAGSASAVALNSIVSAYPDCLDAVSYHPYGMTAAQIGNAQAFIQQNFHLPGVISEWGISALGSNGGPEGQASKIGAFIGDVKRLNIPLTSIYEWKNSDSGSNDRERNFGLLTSDGQPKPAQLTARTQLNAQ